MKTFIGFQQQCSGSLGRHLIRGRPYVCLHFCPFRLGRKSISRVGGAEIDGSHKQFVTSRWVRRTCGSHIKSSVRSLLNKNIIGSITLPRLHKNMAPTSWFGKPAYINTDKCLLYLTMLLTVSHLLPSNIVINFTYLLISKKKYTYTNQSKHDERVVYRWWGSTWVPTINKKIFF